MDIALTATYAMAVLLLIATPGPVVALVISTTASSGPRKAVETALGTNGGSLVLIAAAALAISGVLALSQKTLLLVSLAGCLYIGWLAACAILEGLDAGRAEEDGRRTTRGGFLSGLLMGISNPKDIVFFVSFFPQFIRVTDSVERSMILLSAIWIAVDLLVLGTYIFFLGRVVSKRLHRTISLVSAVILLAIAVLGFAYNIVELRQLQRCAIVFCL